MMFDACRPHAYRIIEQYLALQDMQVEYLLVGQLVSASVQMAVVA